MNEERNLTGLRVWVFTSCACCPTSYGIARVRYGDGHRHAGRYEVEFIDCPPSLVPFDDVFPAPNADKIPLGVGFPETENYEPRFLDGTRRAFLSTGPGVIVPGDTA